MSEPTSDEPPQDAQLRKAWDKQRAKDARALLRRFEIIRRIEKRRFNSDVHPEAPVPRFMIQGKPVCTPGNLTNLIAQAKSGKSSFAAAIIAAAISAELGHDDRDTLGVTASKPDGRQLVTVDTEQSPYDHDHFVRTALRRAGVERAPDWLASYCLTGASANGLRESFAALMEEAELNGGVFAAIIDGAADLVNDVNDAKECNAFVAQLHEMAIRFNCPIICVVHENPGQVGGKMRGHLGSQLERKAESNLRIQKSDEVTVVFSEKMRRAPILEKDGPRFTWSDEQGMHVSCANAGTTRDDAQREQLRDLAEEVLSVRKLRHVELAAAIETARSLSKPTAERRIAAMRKFGVITRDMMGFYSIHKPLTAAA